MSLVLLVPGHSHGKAPVQQRMEGPFCPPTTSTEHIGYYTATSRNKNRAQRDRKALTQLENLSC
ncbi:hypothetical protein E2C01_071713 [Portunus trituberculatus]|uniref:Uncharacterized protein n=1 Tax=Portunus trituberculatus TaxID=210409 RepID=A0A5B7I0L0_PORTR|nr:hypothetical protein [Portunus trituberculatus]